MLGTLNAQCIVYCALKIPDKHVVCWIDVHMTQLITTLTLVISIIHFRILTVQHTEALEQDTAHSHLALWMIFQLEKNKKIKKMY